MTEGMEASKSIALCKMLFSHFGAMRVMNKAVKTEVGTDITKLNNVVNKVVNNKNSMPPVPSYNHLGLEKNSPTSWRITVPDSKE